MNTGELFLTFGETIDGSSIQISLFVIQDARANPQMSVTLTNGTFPTNNDIRTVITLAGTDLDLIKFRNLGNNQSDTYLALEAGAILDAAGNPGVERTLQASEVILDITTPTLSTFDFDLNVGVMTLGFDEAVILSSFQLGELVLSEEVVDTTDVEDFSAFSSNVDYAPNSLRDLRIEFTNDELNEIKRIQVCRDNITCYLYFPRSLQAVTITDIAGNPVEIIQFFEGRPVSTFTPDTTPPTLVGFSAFDLNTGRLIVSFDETVNVSSVQVSEVTLAQWYTLPRLTTPPYSLSEGTIFSENGPMIEIQLSITDLNGIKMNSAICGQPLQCFIQFTTNFLSDMAGNMVAEVVLRQIEPLVFPLAEIVGNFTDDTTSPNLVSYDFDLNTGELVLTFDEPVVQDGFQASQITCQNAFLSTSSYSIVEATLPGRVIGTILRTNLSDADLIQIKARSTLATDNTTTYVTITSDLIADNSELGNSVNVLANGISALQVTIFLGDVTSPSITDFSILDLDSGTLQVIFNEPIDINTFDSTGFHLQSEIDQGTMLTILSATVSYSSFSNDLTTVDIAISDDDFRNLKLLTNLGTSDTDSFLFVDSGSINDLAGNPVQPRFSNNSLPVNSYVRDITPPNLIFSSLDLNLGVLVLSFNDIMLASSFRVNLLSIQGNSSIPTVSFSLTDAANVTTENGYNITIVLTDNDLNEIKANTQLASSPENAYIVMASNAITDVAGVEVIARSNTGAFRTNEYIFDTTNPILERFTFDLGGGVLVLSFTEAVDTVNFAPNQITLQNVANASDTMTFSYNIMAGQLVSTPNRQIFEFFPSVADLNNIKSLLTLGTSVNNTYIVIPSEAFQDLNSNPIVEIDADNALRASDFSDDVVPPTVSMYSFDLNRGIIDITFSESIQISSINYTGFVLRSSQTNPATEYLLTSGNTTAMGGNIIDVLISTSDLNEIKALTDLASLPGNTFLSILAGTYEDPSGNPGIPYGTSQALLANNFIPDTTDPVIDSYNFDLGLGIITLTLSETVDPATLVPDAFTIQSSPAFPVDTQVI